MNEPSSTPVLRLAGEIAGRYGRLPVVESVVLGGSLSTGSAISGSDIDLYVYLREDLPLEIRRQAPAGRSVRAEIGNRFWEPGDEWIDEPTGIHVDVMFRAPQWIEDQLERVLVRHEASAGYSTCFWYNVLHSQILVDRGKWFAKLQRSSDLPYPEPLRRAIVAKNHPLLRRNLSSYRAQIEKAAARRDLVSVNHRVAALLASYFDVLFALNRQPHPGEKRLVEFSMTQCALVPPALPSQVERLLSASAAINAEVLQRVDELVDGLDELLVAEGLL